MYEQFNYQKLLPEYSGSNEYILQMKVNYSKDRNWKPSSEENEYLVKNFRFCGWEFPKVKISIGEKTEQEFKEKYKEDLVSNGKYDIPLREVWVSKIIGETKEKYHVSIGKYFFWVYKDESDNIYSKIYDTVSVDFDWLNSHFTDSAKKFKPHQETAIKFMLWHQKCFLLDDVGMGKTYSCIGATLAAKCNKVLIICLAGNKINWRKELNALGQECRIINGVDGWSDSNCKYTIINFDILSHYHHFNKKGERKKISELYRPLANEGFDCIIVDEMHRCKNDTNISKVITDLTANKSVKYVWGMSATPVEKNEDLFKICRSLNLSIPNIIYTTSSHSYIQSASSYEDYVRIYCGKIPIMKNGKKIWINTKKGNMPIFNTNSYELRQRIKHKILRRVKEQYLEGFDGYETLELNFELNSQQRKKYDKIFENYIKKMEFLAKTKKLKDFDSAVWEESQHLVETILLRQFLAEEKVKHTIQFVKDEIEDGKKVLIFTHFQKELELLEKAFAKNGVVVRSGDTAEKKQAAIDKFMESDSINVIMGNIICLGTGHNIQKADVVIFNSPNWNSGEMEQGVGRAYRIGRVGAVAVYVALFDETIEQEIYERAKYKGENKKILIDEEY